MLLYYFDLKKIAVKAHRLLSKMYGDETPSERTCRVCFECFRNGDFHMRDEERPGQPKKFEDFELQKLLDENPAQTFLELSQALNVTPEVVSKRLHAMGKIHKEGIWLLYEVSEYAILNRLSIASSLFDRQRKEFFYGTS